MLVTGGGMAHGMRPRCDDVADEADQRVEQTLKVLAHEIRQPLAAIFALAEAARTRPDVPAEVQSQLARIIEQTQELTEVTRSVVDPQACADPQRLGEVDADEVVESVLDAFALTWTGTLDRSGHCGELPVVGHRAALRRCLVNVLDNAVRAAGPAGRVVVTTRRTPATVKVLVEDDGPGFGKVPGRTGLGLEITRQVLADMGGELVVGLPGRGGGGSVALVLRAAAAELRRADRPVRVV
ncbi:HAMP domain-containing sensor histidine kinase [Blastococcus brunescens]|uniref:histidine kinase n=1 Tax=Blastococcus brunescens TaxID=1564165 RepID=A0ABZ1B0J9_9ACTN|nr:HAMP domain-containing sensor histidine kinase [Blastococcus sp. BMG 8361]WRL64329.1 HAMP domain-containing sensor histidine kinase [Blastococcus sp. BMG 8361]